jgi:hypothetical protein
MPSDEEIDGATTCTMMNVCILPLTQRHDHIISYHCRRKLVRCCHERWSAADTLDRWHSAVDHQSARACGGHGRPRELVGRCLPPHPAHSRYDGFIRLCVYTQCAHANIGLCVCVCVCVCVCRSSEHRGQASGREERRVHRDCASSIECLACYASMAQLLRNGP